MASTASKGKNIEMLLAFCGLAYCISIVIPEQTAADFH
jgi:hypothetical protein